MERIDGKELKERLFNPKTNGWEKLSDDDLKDIFQYANEYMFYLNSSKTEKEII